MAGPGSYRIGDEEKEQVLDVLKSGYLFRYGRSRGSGLSAQGLHL